MTSTLRTRPVAILALAALVLAVPPGTRERAWADSGPAAPVTTLPRPTDPRALQHFEAGNAWLAQAKAATEPAAQRKAYEEAVKEFLEAAKTERDALFSIFWNLGHAHQKLGQITRAEWYYRRFLDLAPAQYAGHRAAARDAIADLEAAASAEDDSAHEAPTVPSPGPQAPPAPPTPPRWYEDRIGWTLVGAGVVVAGAGGWLMWSGAELHDKANSEHQASVAKDYIDRGDRRFTLGAIVGGVGVAVVAAGALKLSLTSGGPGDQPAATIAVSPGGVLVFGTF